MRNLKRALSLALATVMLLGMMVIGAGARGIDDFSDKATIANQDAAAVTSALGVFAGYTDGTFRPTNVVTRAEMAVIIAKLLYGSDVNPDSFATSSVFTDVPAWAEGYVNLIASLGIVAGIGNNQFAPDRTVTTVEAGLMLSKTLGYFKNESDYGNNWVLAASAKATAIGLYKGIEKLGANDGLTRDSVAQMTFNAMTQAVPVEYSEMFNVYYNVSSGLIYGLEFRYTETLGYTNFDLVYKNDGHTDIQGRPAITWGTGSVKSSSNSVVLDEKGNLISNQVNLLGRNEIITQAREADHTYTGNTKAKAIYSDLGKDVCDPKSEDFGAWTVYYNGQKLDDTTALEFNGTANTVKATSAQFAAEVYLPVNGTPGDYNWIQNGEVAEFYLETENNGDVNVTVVIYGNYLGEVDNVRTDKDGRYVTLTSSVISNARNYKLDDNDFYVEDYEEEDVVLFTIGYDDDDFVIFSVAEPETKEGSLTAVVLDEWYVRLDGSKATLSKHYNDNPFEAMNDLTKATLKNNHRAYLDPNGYVLSIEPLEDAETKYVYVQNMDKYLGDYQAKVVFSDGTKATVNIDEVYLGYTAYNNGTEDKNPTLSDYTKHVCAYTVSKDKYTLISLVLEDDIVIEKDKRSMLYDGGAIRLSEDTVFVDIENGKVYTGYKNVPDYKDSAFGAYGIEDKGTTAEVVFITDGAPSSEKTRYIWFEKVGTGNIEKVEYEDTTYRVYTNAYEDGTQVKEEYVKESKGLYVDQLAHATIQSQNGGKGMYEVLTVDGNDIVKTVKKLSPAADGIYLGYGKVTDVSTDTIWYNKNTDYITFDKETLFVLVNKDGVASAGSRNNITTKWPGGESKYYTVWVVEYDVDDNYAEVVYIFEESKADAGLNFAMNTVTYGQTVANVVAAITPDYGTATEADVDQELYVGTTLIATKDGAGSWAYKTGHADTDKVEAGQEYKVIATVKATATVAGTDSASTVVAKKALTVTPKATIAAPATLAAVDLADFFTVTGVVGADTVLDVAVAFTDVVGNAAKNDAGTVADWDGTSEVVTGWTTGTTVPADTDTLKFTLTLDNDNYSFAGGSVTFELNTTWSVKS